MSQTVIIALQLLLVAFCIWHANEQGSGPGEIALLLAAGAVGLRVFMALQ